MFGQNSFIVRFLQKITTLFFTGLIVLLPVTLTVAVLTFSFRMITKWLDPLRFFIKSIPLLDLIPHVEILLAFLIILTAGIIYNIFIIRTIIHAVENLLIKIPIIRPVYSGFKQLVKAFSLQDKMMFKSVVIIEFPRPGVYSIGFLTSEIDKTFIPQQKTVHESLQAPPEREHTRFFTVFIPTTPNPTSGFLILAPDHEITIAPISTQEAMAMIISGGIIRPGSEQSKTEH